MSLEKLEKVWEVASAWPGYTQAMRALVSPYFPKGIEGNKQFVRWASFPGLCCQAAGGQAEWADPLSAAWLVFYGAAYLMDSVEDRDEPAPEWACFSPGMVVNGASGLFFSASIILSDLRKQPHLHGRADRVIEEFYLGFLQMCAGQHRDLATDRPSLEDYWEIAAGKSGTFFATASRLGAQLASDEAQRLKCFHDFGLQLGILVQVLDDIDDLQKAALRPSWYDFYKSLPVIYALKHARPGARIQLEALIQAGGKSPEAVEALVDMVDQTGAVRYLLCEFDKQRNKAITALHKARLSSAEAEKLITFLPNIRK